MARHIISYREGTQPPRIYAFHGVNDDIWVNYWDGTQWRWANQGSPNNTKAGGVPGVVTYPDAGGQRIYAFLRGIDGALHVHYWNGNQWNWARQGNPPAAPSTTVDSATSAVAYQEAGTQRIHAFLVAHNKKLYMHYWDGKGPNWLWEDLGAPPSATLESSPTAVTYHDQNTQRFYVFVRTRDGHLWVRHSAGLPQWESWVDLGTPEKTTLAGSTVGAAPSVITYPEGNSQRIYIFGAGKDGHLHVSYWDGGPQWRWADQGLPPGPLGTTVEHALDAVTYREGNIQRIYVFVRGSDGKLYVNYWDGTQWQWADQGTPATGEKLSPTMGAVTYSEGGKQRIHVLAKGENGTFLRNHWDGTQWRWDDTGTPSP